ncbi:16S rRNA (uracil(1498)-N(3))-methyltransferase [Sphaerospermopsis aphanizomenoides BCCUSP55]|uniref:16S rRNA (uracil(1498)-N(3))-methyltransferase n=1 Tax=Sphaerospermopsis aphanizomenoides TaxID=459663 RepID=UPI000A8FA187|nr:16S rRNA (uracil(1498)-N(3))-methyltransferase [Sphaerospermopsis aphanizomenoides]MBK1987846.1 16S rRNA (uracil(1498)-N(3))-methyltransferase [Sphaerospermopsis aphanizomenoides BCCUSP55]
MSQLQRITINPSQLQQTQLLLTHQQQHYLFRVLRLQDGDKFIAMDGIGKWWLTQLTGETGQVLELLEVKTELPVSITLMVALPKGNGFDDVVRCCTELGVTCIIPVLSDRTLLNPSPQKLERWQRIASEAAEQSERAFVPTILEPVTFSSVLSECAANHRYLCEARSDYPHLTKVLNNNHLSGEITIAIGPEGGWTDQEIEMAIDKSFQPVSLGRRILRAVTAPVVALSLIAAACEV